MFWKALKIGGLAAVLIMTLAAALLSTGTSEKVPAVSSPQPAAPAQGGTMRFN